MYNGFFACQMKILPTSDRRFSGDPNQGTEVLVTDEEVKKGVGWRRRVAGVEPGSESWLYVLLGVWSGASHELLWASEGGVSPACCGAPLRIQAESLINSRALWNGKNHYLVQKICIAKYLYWSLLKIILKFSKHRNLENSQASIHLPST